MRNGLYFELCKQAEMTMNQNPILYESFQFSMEVVTFYQYLAKEHKEYILLKQLLCSGTSVGANITKLQDAQSKKDFIFKMSIALKEAQETRYWLSLLEECGYIDKDVMLTTYKKRSFKLGKQFSHIEELVKILSSIVKTSKQQ